MYLAPYLWNDLDLSGRYCILIFCHDDKGEVVCIKIKDWLPFFYIKVKNCKTLDSGQAEKILDGIISDGYQKFSIENKRELYYYEAEYYDLIKVSFKSIKEMTQFYYKSIENKSVEVIEYHYPNKRSREVIPQIKKFQIEIGITYTSWIEANGEESNKIISNETEYDVSWKTIKKSDKIFEIDPKKLFFDLETYSTRLSAKPGKPGVEDEIFQNGIVIEQKGKMKKIMQLVLGKCDKVEIKDCEMRYYKNDRDLILDFCEIVKEHKPTIISHFNGNIFDLPYMDARLSLTDKWPNASKLKINDSKFCTSSFSNSANYDGGVVRSSINWPGILWIDMYRFVKANYGDKLKMFSLDNVLKHFLNKSKVDFKWQLINMTYRLAKDIDWYQHRDFMQLLSNSVHEKTGRKHDIDEETKDFANDAMLCCAEYCLGDVINLPELFNHLKVFMRLSEEANILEVDIDNIHTGNSGSKANVLFYKYARKTGRFLMMPLDLSSFKYIGGNVINPVEEGTTGVHIYVPTLDFTGMYPGIIISERICFSSLIKDIKNFKGSKDDYNMIVSDTPEGGKRVTYWYNKEDGVIPLLLIDIKKARDYYKTLAKQHKGTMLGDIYEERQLALKKQMNSVYGLLGRRDGGLGLMEGAEATTQVGRNDQKIARDVAEAEVPIDEKGIQAGGFKCIYGDTDSIMIIKPGRDPELLIEDTKAVISKINENFKSPKSIDYEKTLKIIFLVAGKNYCYLLYDKKEELDFSRAVEKGLASKKRDTPEVAGYIMKKMIQKIIEKYWNEFRFVTDEEKKEKKIQIFVNKLLQGVERFVVELHQGKHDKMLSKIMVFTGKATSETSTGYRFGKAMIEAGVDITPGDRFEVYLCNVPEKTYVGEKLKTKELIEQHGYKFDYDGYEALIYKKVNKLISLL